MLIPHEGNVYMIINSLFLQGFKHKQVVAVKTILKCMLLLIIPQNMNLVDPHDIPDLPG